MKIRIGKPHKGDVNHVTAGEEYEVRSVDKENGLYLIWDDKESSWWVNQKSIASTANESLKNLIESVDKETIKMGVQKALDFLASDNVLNAKAELDNLVSKLSGIAGGGTTKQIIDSIKNAINKLDGGNSEWVTGFLQSLLRNVSKPRPQLEADTEKGHAGLSADDWKKVHQNYLKKKVMKPITKFFRGYEEGKGK